MLNTFLEENARQPASRILKLLYSFGREISFKFIHTHHPERRLLLDYPDAATEASCLQRSTDLSRGTLISKTPATPDTLTDAEIALLQQNFWLDITHQQASQQRKALSPALQDASERLYQVRKNAHRTNEEQAILNAMMQHVIRMQGA